MRWLIIGLGGIGNKLLPDLCEQLNYDEKEEHTIVLVDGDRYEDKNRRRQRFGTPLILRFIERLEKLFEAMPEITALKTVFQSLIDEGKSWAAGLGNKAEVMARQLSAEYPRLFFETIPCFVKGPNDAVNEVWKDRVVPVEQVIQDGDFVVICVDNFKTRATICQFCNTLQNVKVLNLGNKDNKGHGILWVRRGGRDINAFPPILKEHPEILDGKSKAPHELSCEALAQSDPQVPLENRFAADIGLFMIRAELDRKLKHNEYWFDSMIGMIVPQVKWEQYSALVK